jgi:NADPH:quinone reductase-like Zn-dependent oxidoreductase
MYVVSYMSRRSRLTVFHLQIMGEDIAGTVVDVGSGVTTLKKGDRVAAIALHIVTKNSANAGFQLYTALSAGIPSRIPDDMSFNDAVVLPLGLTTAASALFSPEYLGIDPPSASGSIPTNKNKAVVIWGGSGSVGSCAIQLCAAAGLTVLTTVSPRNFEYAKAIGATEAFDYNDSAIVEELTKAAHGKAVIGVYDTVASKTSLAACVSFLQAVGGGKISHTLAYPEDLEIPEGVAAVAGQPSLKGPDGGLPIWRQVWMDFMGLGLKNRKLKAKPDAYVLKGGLRRLDEGIDLVRKGVSARKVVIELIE